MQIELVVFDMAGTTVHDDDNVGVALRDALRAGGVEVSPEEVNAAMGWPKPVAIKHLLERARGVAEPEEIDRLHRSFVSRMVRHYSNDPFVREIPGTSRVFRWLKERGIKVAVDTGFSRPIADAILARTGWAVRGLIDTSVTSDEVARGRPHPDLIYAAMSRTKVHHPSSVVKVGDTPSDLQQGRSAGCGLVIGVTRGTHTKEQLEVHPHDLLLPTVASLPGALLGHVGGPLPKRLAVA
jgi:phosphonatase-like hydrolase